MTTCLLHPAPYGTQIGKSAKCLIRVAATTDHQTHRHKCVCSLEMPDQGQGNIINLGLVTDGNFLSRRCRTLIQQANITFANTDSDNAVTARFTNFLNIPDQRAVGIQHRRL